MFRNGVESKCDYVWRDSQDTHIGFVDFVPEARLPVAMVGSIFLPVCNLAYISDITAHAVPPQISLFWFGWTSASSIPWIVPIIGSAFFTVGAFLLFQAGLKYVLLVMLLHSILIVSNSYLSDCYPRYVASILAGNDFFRSCVGAAFPLFSTAFFHNLGVGQACSVLGGISVAMMPIPFVL